VREFQVMTESSAYIIDSNKVLAFIPKMIPDSTGWRNGCLVRSFEPKGSPQWSYE